MRKSYKNVKDICFVDQKKYILEICQKEDLNDVICECMNDKQFERVMKNQSIRQQLYIMALKELYKVTNFETMEYHLVMMNSLFDEQSYDDIKRDLLNKLCQRPITIDEYCVMRHLIDFHNMPFSFIVKRLNTRLNVSDEECAKICLLEDQYEESLVYLKRLDDCENEAILDLLCSYSFFDYLSLMRHYSKKREGYQLVFN